MSADNYVRVRRFGPNDYRWGMWFASDDNPDYSDKRFKHGPFSSPNEAAENAWDELRIIEYGVEFEHCCLRSD